MSITAPYGDLNLDSDEMIQTVLTLLRSLAPRYFEANAGQTLGATRELGSTWSLRQSGDGWLLDAGREHGNFRRFRGFDHLHTMLANPNRDVAATDLEAGIPTAARGIPALDERALAAYRRRLAEIAGEVDSADLTGDQARSSALQDERSQVLAELRRATGLGGRVRLTNDAAERARVNVTRNIKRALDQIQRAAPIAGWHLTTSIHTGAYCRYVPADGGPDGWALN